jgi:hypothetical protein
VPSLRFIPSKLRLMVKSPWIAVACCSLALFGQTILPPVHIWLETLEFEEAIQQHDPGAIVTLAGTMRLRTQQTEGHDESTCPVCQAVKYHSLASVQCVPSCELSALFLPVCSCLGLIEIDPREDWKILSGRSPPFFA